MFDRNRRAVTQMSASASFSAINSNLREPYMKLKQPFFSDLTSDIFAI